MKEQFDRDGYIANVPIDVSQPPSHYRGIYEKFEQFHSPMGWHQSNYDIFMLSTSPDIVDKVKSVLGVSDVFLFATHFFCKYGPDAEKFVAWHQDVKYWGLNPPLAVTAWYAIDDSDEGNGCMRVIPGTHIAGLRDHHEYDGSGNILTGNQETIVTDEEVSRAENIIVDAGHISLHHGMIVHSSVPNLSSRRRCGLAIRFCPMSVELNKQNWKPIAL